MAKFLKPVQSDQEDQFDQLGAEIAQAIDTKVGDVKKDFASLDEKTQAKFKDMAGEIERMKAEADASEAKWRKRYQELCENHRLTGQADKLFGTVEAQIAMSKMLRSVLTGDRAAGEKAHADYLKATGQERETANVSPVTGPQGGYVLQHEMLSGLIANFAQYGAAERLLDVQTTGAQKGSMLVDKAEFEIYHPDIGYTPSATTDQTDPNFEMPTFNLTAFDTYNIIENWMLEDDSVIALAPWLMQKIARAQSRGLDIRWLLGEGSKSHAKILGVFKRNGVTGQNKVTCDSGDNTFDEVIAAHVKYLAKAVAALPDNFADLDQSWIMHRSIFFSFLGLKDTTGQPIANMLFSPTGLQAFVLGYPVNLVTAAHKLTDTAASKVIYALGPWRDCYRVIRHKSGIVVRQSDQVFWREKRTAFNSSIRQDVVKVAEGDVLVETNAA